MATKTLKLTKTVKAKNATSRTGSASAARKSILETVHETAKGLYDAGVINKTTMREFDTVCVPKVPTYKPHQIKAIRDRCNASQAVFAAYMNISPSSLQKWETGNKKPTGVAMKLLNIIDHKGLDALL